MKVIIDGQSGCCNGVKMAIERAEAYLKEHDKLNSLGAIVHNDAEIRRLAEMGLETIGYGELPAHNGETVLIRAHGEPPSTYETARRNNIAVIDCTCPVVLALQKRIAATYSELRPAGGTILIFGKRGHAEVNGLVGQTDGTAIVIKDLKELKQMIRDGKTDIRKPVSLFSQTTKDPIEFKEIADYVLRTFKNKTVRINDTICRSVSSRHRALVEFSKKCSVIIFVSGKESSNGKVLFDLCRKVNRRSYKIESAEELSGDIFRKGDVVGICGATSTTRWQLEKIAAFIEKIDPARRDNFSI